MSVVAHQACFCTLKPTRLSVFYLTMITSLTQPFVEVSWDTGTHPTKHLQRCWDANTWLLLNFIPCFGASWVIVLVEVPFEVPLSIIPSLRTRELESTDFGTRSCSKDFVFQHKLQSSLESIQTFHDKALSHYKSIFKFSVPLLDFFTPHKAPKGKVSNQPKDLFLFYVMLLFINDLIYSNPPRNV